MPKPSLAKKLQGSLIGFAIGDAMGATTEFCVQGHIVYSCFLK